MAERNLMKDIPFEADETELGETKNTETMEETGAHEEEKSMGKDLDCKIITLAKR